jgi:hypothetical protein
LSCDRFIRSSSSYKSTFPLCGFNLSFNGSGYQVSTATASNLSMTAAPKFNGNNSQSSFSKQNSDIGYIPFITF